MKKALDRLRTGVLLLALMGCGNLNTPQAKSLNQLQLQQPVTTIQQLQQQPEQSQAIYLRGQVVKQVPLAGSFAYALQDNTGLVWVVTKQNVPAPGATLLIKGVIRYQSIPIGGKDMGEVYVEEQEQLERT